MVKKGCELNSHHRNNVQTDPHCLTTVVFAHDATGNSVTTVLHMCSPKFALNIEVPSPWWVSAKRDDGGKSGRILAHLDLLQSLSRPGSFGGSLQATLRGLVFSLANRRVTQPPVVRVLASQKKKRSCHTLRDSLQWCVHVLPSEQKGYPHLPQSGIAL